MSDRCINYNISWLVPHNACGAGVRDIIKLNNYINTKIIINTNILVLSIYLYWINFLLLQYISLDSVSPSEIHIGASETKQFNV